MKTYVITVSRTFPSTHKRKGEETHFINKILLDDKIHTIRANYPLWKKRFDKIEKGEACLSLRYWSGLPRKSKQVEFLRLTKEDGIGLQKLEFDRDLNDRYSLKLYSINNMYSSTIERIAVNDGLSFDDFKEWFKGYDLSEPMAIIHFTKFRY